MSKKLLGPLGLLLIASMVLAACGSAAQPTQQPTDQGAVVKTVVAETFAALTQQAPTATLQPINTATVTLSPATRTPTASKAPTMALPTNPPQFIPKPASDPGDTEMKKIDPKFMDGGPMQFFGNDLTDFGHPSDGNWHGTEGYRELVIYRIVSVPHFLLTDKNSYWRLQNGVQYYRYRLPETVDAIQLIQELAYDAPNGSPFTVQLYGVSVIPEPALEQTFMQVTYDYAHVVDEPGESWNKNPYSRNLKKDDVLTFQGWAMIYGTCDDSNAVSVFVVQTSLTARCNMKAIIEEAYFISNGNKDLPRAGSAAENDLMRAYMIWLSGVRVTTTNAIERYITGTTAEYLGWQPIDQFETIHSVKPTATSTLVATATRTPMPTYTLRPSPTATNTKVPTMTLLPTQTP